MSVKLNCRKWFTYADVSKALGHRAAHRCNITSLSTICDLWISNC